MLRITASLEKFAYFYVPQKWSTGEYNGELLIRLLTIFGDESNREIKISTSCFARRLERIIHKTLLIRIHNLGSFFIKIGFGNHW